jgi:hypothetical protein
MVPLGWYSVCIVYSTGSFFNRDGFGCASSVGLVLWIAAQSITRSTLRFTEAKLPFPSPRLARTSELCGYFFNCKKQMTKRGEEQSYALRRDLRMEQPKAAESGTNIFQHPRCT